MGFQYKWMPTIFKANTCDAMMNANVSSEPKWVYVVVNTRDENIPIHFKTAEEFDQFIEDLHEARKQADY